VGTEHSTRTSGDMWQEPTRLVLGSAQRQMTSLTRPRSKSVSCKPDTTVIPSFSGLGITSRGSTITSLKTHISSQNTLSRSGLAESSRLPPMPGACVNRDKEELKLLNSVYGVDATSTLTIFGIFDEIKRVLEAIRISYSGPNVESQSFHCKHPKTELEIKIARLPLQSISKIHGLQVRRLKGNISDFQFVRNQILSQMHL